MGEGELGKPLSPQASDLPFPRYACLLSRNFRFARDPSGMPEGRKYHGRHRIEDQCAIGGAGVPSDHLPTQTRKIVTRSSGSFAAITGEPGRLPPQIFAALPATRNIRCGCQLMPWSLRYCCFDNM